MRRQRGGALDMRGDAQPDVSTERQPRAAHEDRMMQMRAPLETARTGVPGNTGGDVRFVREQVTACDRSL